MWLPPPGGCPNKAIAFEFDPEDEVCYKWCAECTKIPPEIDGREDYVKISEGEYVAFEVMHA